METPVIRADKRLIGALVAISLLAFGNYSTAGEPEKPLSGDDIMAWLEGNTAISTKQDAPSKQVFVAGGATRYTIDGKSISTGYWRIRMDSYCSVWPPSSNWVCYGVTGSLAGEDRRLTFISHESKFRYPVIIKQGVLF